MDTMGQTIYQNMHTQWEIITKSGEHTFIAC